MRKGLKREKGLSYWLSLYTDLNSYDVYELTRLSVGLYGRDTSIMVVPFSLFDYNPINNQYFRESQILKICEPIIDSVFRNFHKKIESYWEYQDVLLELNEQFDKPRHQMDDFAQIRIEIRVVVPEYESIEEDNHAEEIGESFISEMRRIGRDASYSYTDNVEVLD